MTCRRERIQNTRRREPGRLFDGVSPSGKAPGFDPGIRRFESCHPSQTTVQPVERDNLRRPHYFLLELGLRAPSLVQEFKDNDPATIDKRSDSANDLEVTNIVGDD